MHYGQNIQGGYKKVQNTGYTEEHVGQIRLYEKIPERTCKVLESLWKGETKAFTPLHY